MKEEASHETDASQRVDGGQAPYRIIGQSPPPGNPPSRFVFFHLDHLGSPRLILDETGVTVSQHHYLAFGEELPAPPSPDPTQNRRAFTGHERDAESGLDYMMARYYSSSIGRFMSVDPSDKEIKLENPQTWNHYSYVLNNPVRFTDPDGKKLNDEGEKRAKSAMKDNSLTKEEKARIQAARDSEAQINLTDSKDASIIVTPKDGGAPTTSTGAPKDIKKEKADAQKKGDDVQSRDATILPEVDAKGKVTGAAITIHSGNYDISPLGKESGRSIEAFKNKVFAEELRHVEGGKVNADEKGLGHVPPK